MGEVQYNWGTVSYRDSALATVVRCDHSQVVSGEWKSMLLSYTLPPTCHHDHTVHKSIEGCQDWKGKEANGYPQNGSSYPLDRDIPGGSDGKESACNAGDTDSIPESGRSPGERSGNPLEYFCMVNFMDRRAWRATVNGSQRVGCNWGTNTHTHQLDQFSSVTQLGLTLSNPMDCSTPGIPVHYQLAELAQLMSIESVMPSNHLILYHPLSLSNLSQHHGLFPSVLYIRWPKYWSFSFRISPSNKYIGLISFKMTGWISLLSKGFSRVFSNTTVQKHQFSGAQLSSQSNYHSHTLLQEKP